MWRILYTLSIAALGFLAGWWANERLSPTAAINAPARPVVDTRSASPLPDSPATAPAVRPTAPDFNLMLASSDIDAAMLAYDTLTAENPAHHKRLRAAVMYTLERALAEGDGETLQLLADAWLARYYDDVDVLLILAEFQSQLGYPDEAVRVLQYAATYAHQPDQRDKVSSAISTLVQQTQNTLADEGLWMELLGFYQLLESIGLSGPEYRLAQALVYLELGDADTARNLLEPLTGEAALASRATALLARLDQPGAPPAFSPDFSDSIALQRQGGHYLAPVRLNDEVETSLMIDTGASITSLTQERFDRLSRGSQFDYVGWRLFNTAGGPVRGTIYRARSLQLGENLLREVDIAVLDYGPRGEVDGLLGMNVLRHFHFEIDQDRELLHLRQR